MGKALLNLDPIDFDDDAPTITRDCAASRAPVAPRIDETWIDYDPLPPVGPPGQLHWSPLWRGAGVRETDDLAEAVIVYDLSDEDAA